MSHLGQDPGALQVVSSEFEFYERPNLHLAIESILAKAQRRASITGIVAHYDHERPTLAKLSRKLSAGQYAPGPVEHVDVPLATGHLSCVRKALYTVRDHGKPLALLVCESYYGRQENIIVEVMSPDREHSQRFLRELVHETRVGRAHRGHVISIGVDCYHRVSVEFHHLPQVRRDQIILPEAVIQQIERHSLSFTKHAERLRQAKRHLKRGILLHGPPGTGKTLSAMYLASQMSDRTVLMMTGSSINALETACTLARMLVPATVVLEDVDLIGTERDFQSVGANALLFELLNQMDGLAEDSDILFVLTTNRPDVLEPALSARPGRIDQAIHIPLPDAQCRRRLLDLYSEGLNLKLSRPEDFVRRTDGASAAFIRELLRKATVFAAERNGDSRLIVTDQDMEAALRELLVTRGDLTRSLLGAAPTRKMRRRVARRPVRRG
jgi:AAA+ superfamily predicted ATPase